jgi:DNA-binding CsgD family transcriptional regulator
VTRPDFLTAVEASYAPAATDEAWLARVLETVAPILGGGMGTLAHFCDASDPKALRVWGPVSAGAPDGWAEVTVGLVAGAPPDIVERVYRSPRPGVTASQLFGRGAWSKENNRAITLAPMGIADAIGLVCTDATHRGCVLTAPLPRVTTIRGPDRHRLGCLAAHVAAGLRLRWRGGSAPEHAEAVLDPDGQVVHAEVPAQSGDAREALRRFAIAVEGARGAVRRRDPDAALDLWTAMLEGRWSLVDHFDSDGRRFFLAQRNDLRLDAPPALTEMEKQVAAYVAKGHPNKLIGYELGVSVSTIATHLGRALAKLGLQSRADITRIAGLISVPEP